METDNNSLHIYQKDCAVNWHTLLKYSMRMKPQRAQHIYKCNLSFHYVSLKSELQLCDHTHTTGFTVGDELGLPESIGTVEGNKRRSLSDRDTFAAANSIGVLPASKLPVIVCSRTIIPSIVYQIHLLSSPSKRSPSNRTVPLPSCPACRTTIRSKSAPPRRCHRPHRTNARMRSP